MLTLTQIFRGLPLYKTGDVVRGVEIHPKNLFLNWCHEDEEDMKLLISWYQHFKRKGIPCVVGRGHKGATIWKHNIKWDRIPPYERGAQ